MAIGCLTVAPTGSNPPSTSYQWCELGEGQSLSFLLCKVGASVPLTEFL